MSQRKLKKLRKIHEESVRVIESYTGPVEKLQFLKIIKENIVFLAIILLAIIVVFANGMQGDFVSDDYATILNNPELTEWQYAFRGGATTYFIHSMVAKVFGVAPLQYHLSSLVIFMVTCVLAFVLVYHLFGKVVAWLTMSIFIVHPIHVEAVTWISGKPYLLIAMYVLMSLLLFIKFVETEKIEYFGGMWLFFILGFLTDNPRPFSLFFIIPLYLWLFKIDIRHNKWFKYWPWLLLPMLLVLVFFWPHIVSRVTIVNSGTNISESIFYNPFFQYPTGIAKYLQLLWLPIDLTLYHTMYIFPVWLNWLILLSYLGIIIYFSWVDRRYSFALLFILLAILPSMAPVKVSWLVAERYAYLGSLGFCLLLGLIFTKIGNFNKYVAGLLLVLLMVFYSIRTVQRNKDWTTNHLLWVNTCQVSPNSHNAWNNIGDDYDKLKQYDNAIKGFTQSTIVKPNYADAFHNRANIFFKMGRLDLARESYNTALYYSPTLYQTYLSLINIDLTEKKIDQALEDVNKALKVSPNDPTVNYVLAVVLSQMGENSQAIAVLEGILRAYPNHKQAMEALLQLRARSKQ
ncbi:MAG: tetratricopeptide repeat protein [Microgenomates group bacterium]